MTHANGLSAALPQAPRSGQELFGAYPDLLTVQHVKELTGLSEQTIRAEINKGALPGARIGRRLYVPKTQMIDYVMNGGGLNDYR